MDLVLKLREIRRMRGLTQKDVSRLSGVGEKTISSFETGQRIGALKLAQLKRLLSVYGLTESDFFSGSIEKQPKQHQKNLLSKFQLMVETLLDTHGEPSRRPGYVRDPDWQMLTSRN